MLIDYRSDTVTRPTSSMKKVMAEAPVGDDVFGEDPSINALEEKTAALFGMEASLFCPSGTMTNQIAIKAHTQPGDEVICDHTAHVYQYEGGGIAFNAGASVKLVAGDRGRITAAQVAASINADDVHKAQTSLVCLENTSNRGGGSCYELDEIRAIRQVCEQHGLALHLDGARLFNALVARRQSPQEFGALFHSISICMSKSLGCPVGSLLVGSRTFIRKARRIRKVMGGGMRQAGSLAAACSFALDHHVERLEQDHRHAQQIAGALAGQPYVDYLLPVETNIIIFGVKAPYTAASVVEKMKAQGMLGYAFSPTSVRLVLHLDITPVMVEKTIQIIKSL